MKKIKRIITFTIITILISLFTQINIGNANEVDCTLLEPLPCDSVFTKKSKSKIDFYGWILTGITVNNHGTKNDYGDGGHNYGYNRRDGRDGITDQSGNSYILMLEQPSDWKLNQLWVGAKKDLDSQFDWGFRADFSYGTDVRYARNWGDQSFDYKWGSGDYFASFVQLYGTIGTKDLYLKVGKFAGGFAYEGLPATKEFFYSHANICYGRPLTTSGAILEWNVSKKWTLSGGWTAGVFSSLENSNNDNAFLGKATYHFNKKASLTFKVFHNDKGYRSNANRAATDTYSTLIFTYKINDRWFYMIEGAYTDGKVYGATKKGSDAWGINQHLIYTVNEKLSVGLRGEFHHSRASMFDLPLLTIGGQGGDLYEITLAANYKLNPKTIFRPEIRFDQADYNNGYLPFGGHENRSSQISGGCSFVLSF